jgi:hypothetical protein
MSAIAPMLLQRLAAASGGGGAGPAPGGPPMGGPPMMGGGPPGGPGTGPASTPSDMMQSAAFGRELSSQRQADPAALARNIHNVKMMVSEIMSATMASNPGVAAHLAKIIGSLNAAIKEASQSASTLQVASPPINSSAAMGAPGAGGPNPAPTGVPGVGQF